MTIGAMLQPGWCPFCGHGWMMGGGMALFWIVVLAGGAALAWALLRARRGDRRAEEILRERYTRGEIDRETYERMRDDLRGRPPA